MDYDEISNIRNRGVRISVFQRACVEFRSVGVRSAELLAVCEKVFLIVELNWFW